MTYDIHFQGTQGTDEKPISFGYAAAVAVDGPQKVVNRWAKCLLTPKGSDPTSPNEGTDFTRLIGLDVETSQDLLDALAIILEDCADQIRTFDRMSSLPPDEQFGSATLAQIVERDAGGYDVWIRVRNAAGESLSLALPTIG
jgi:hypothetical protein